MARIGLFPLELVLVPTERVPLHIFEPRYKELIGECIERDEEFGIVLDARRAATSHHVGTRAAIAEVLQVLPDGRMHIVVEGGDRFRLLEVDHDRSFATARSRSSSTRTTRPTLPTSSGPRRPSSGCRRPSARRASRPTADSPQLDFEIACARRLQHREQAGADRADLAARSASRGSSSCSSTRSRRSTLDRGAAPARPRQRQGHAAQRQRVELEPLRHQDGVDVRPSGRR